MQTYFYFFILFIASQKDTVQMNNLRFLRHKMEGRAFVLEACFLPPVPTPLPALPFMAGLARPRPSRQRRDSLAECLTCVHLRG